MNVNMIISCYDEIKLRYLLGVKVNEGDWLTLTYLQITKAAADDYNRGRSYLIDLASREGVQLFEDIGEAVECAIDSLPERCSVTPVSRAGTPQKISRPNTPVKMRNPTL